MSSDLVHADVNDVKKLARALERFEKELNDVSKQAERAIGQANWKDGQKDKFEARYKDFSKQTNRFVSSHVREFVKSLNSLAADLEQAKSHRF